MPGLLDSVDPDGLLEYSVVYTDRAVNHMSGRFQQAMNDGLSDTDISTIARVTEKRAGVSFSVK